MTNLRRLQDLQLGNEQLLETYRNYFSSRYIEEAHNLINTNTLKSYVLQAEWMNETKTKIEELEGHKNTEIDENLNDKKDEFQNNINKLLYLNEYNNSVQYYKNNFVLYNNKIYFCIQNSLGNLPINTNYWLDIGLIGNKGQFGLGVNYKGKWESTITYNKNDLVYYENNLYVAISNNSGKIPNKNISGKYLNDDLYLDESLYLGYVETSIYWFPLTKINPQPIYVFPIDYTQLQINSIFLQEIQTKNLFNWQNISVRGDCEINNGIFKNIKTDDRDYFDSQLQAYSNEQYLCTLGSKKVSNTGRYEITITNKMPYGTNRLRFKHNGKVRDIEMFIYDIDIIPPFTISFSVISCNPTNEYGLIVSDIQIENGDSSSPYKPFST